jgi:DNA-3-methyladenine glycosylase I
MAKKKTKANTATAATKKKAAIKEKYAGPNDNKVRCGWCLGDPIYVDYHDNEWGQAVHDDKLLFEFLVLESFQAGLSWLTILRKRENFRKAFADFDVKKVAKFDQKKFDELMQDAGIVRNRLKIEAAINNAARFMETQKEFGSFDKYIWSFVGGKPLVNRLKSMREIQAKTDISNAMSKDMGNRGFKFRGSTICYAFMQAVGMVNDHIDGCWKKKG